MPRRSNESVASEPPGTAPCRRLLGVAPDPLLSFSPPRLVDTLERVEVHSVEALRAWFLENHAQPQSIWLVTWKKATPEKYVSTGEVLDEALCFGWIDGRRKKLDALRTMQLLSPRKASHWAQSYKERVRRLTDEGRMHPSGMRVVEEAKASGMWDFMNDVDALIVPPDLAAALDEHPSARRAFEAFPDSAKRDALRWIKLAKRPETREQRIREVAVKASKGQRASGTR